MIARKEIAQVRTLTQSHMIGVCRVYLDFRRGLESIVIELWAMTNQITQLDRARTRIHPDFDLWPPHTAMAIAQSQDPPQFISKRAMVSLRADHREP